jgi:hypothetical protein
MTAAATAAMVPARRTDSSISEDAAMEPITITTTVDLDHWNEEELLVHEWRTEQLRRLGIRRALAERFAGLVDWHEIAELVERGCSPELALEIAR